MNRIFDNGDKTFTVEYWNDGQLTGAAKYQSVFRVVAGNTNANRVVIVSPDYNIEMSFDTSELEVNGVAVTDAADAFERLKEFVSLDFSGAGGSAIPTFQSNNPYKNGEAIFYNDVIWVAKADFVSGASFDAADWDKVSISVEEFEDGLDEKVDRTGDADRIYGTDGNGEQTTFDRSDFEMVANKTTDIRDADHADDDRYPTELAVRLNLNGVFDSIMADMNTAIEHIANEVMEEKNGSYSFEEVKKTETWVDGKPIYRKCYTGTFSPSTGTDADSVLLETMSILDNFVACGGNVTTPSEAQHKRVIPYTGGDFDDIHYNYYSVCSNNLTKNIYFIHRDAASDTYTGSYTIWIEYTKTTD